MKLFLTSLLSLFLISCSEKNEYNSLKTETIDNLKSIKNEKPKIGIAFGGGGVRGFVHLGVIKALDEAGIEADIVTGTSVGSIVGSFYASGMSFEDIEKESLKIKRSDIADFTLFGDGGMIQGKKIASWIQTATNSMKIEDAPKKYGIAVTDLTNGQPLLITEGDMGEASQTSSTIPGAFVPVKSNGNILVDGGILALVPVNFNRALGADIVIGVDIYCGKKRVPKEQIIRIVVASTRLQSCEIAKHELKNADFVIQPKFEPKDFGDFSSREDGIEAGYEATKEILPELKKIVF